MNNDAAANTAGRNEQSAQKLLDALTALRNGDFSYRLDPNEQTGTEAQIARTFNEIGSLLSALSPEVLRVAREVGTEGRFGPQAEVPGLQGEWAVLVRDINTMAANLTNQVRDFAQTTTAVASGDLTRKVTVGAQGEMEEWKQTVNVMIDQLNSFASELTQVARGVGTDLGGQMEVRGVSGTWRDLIANVNKMSEDLTFQIRSITQVLESIAGGDNSMQLTLEVRGEIARLHAAVEKIKTRLTAASLAGGTA